MTEKKWNWLQKTVGWLRRVLPGLIGGKWGEAIGKAGEAGADAGIWPEKKQGPGGFDGGMHGPRR